MHTAITIGISTIGLFVVFILLKKGKNISDYLLVLINIMLIGMLYTDISISQGLTKTNFIIQNVLPFWLTSVSLTYGLMLIGKINRLSINWLWVYVYSIAFTLFIFIDFTFLTYYTTALLKERFNHPTLAYHLFYKTHFLFVIASFFWFLKQHQKYTLSIKDYYSFIEPIKLRWLKQFSLTILILNVFSLFAFLAYNVGVIKEVTSVFAALNIGIIIAFLFLSVNGIKQYSFIPIQENKNVDVQINESVFDNKEKYATSSLDEGTLKTISLQLTTLFEIEKIYQNSQLKIGHVADQLNVPTHHLSQVINAEFEKTFFDYVNTFRIIELKEKLKNPDNNKYTIIALAFDCGFNSKASVNRIFKDYTGSTPSEYQKANQVI